MTIPYRRFGITCQSISPNFKFKESKTSPLFKIRPTGCPEKTVWNYNSTLSKIPTNSTYHGMKLNKMVEEGPGKASNRFCFLLDTIFLLVYIIIMLILVNDQLDAQFFFSFLYVCFNLLLVSMNLVLKIRRINCINTKSGICHSV
jgi:hypothetical protein